MKLIMSALVLVAAATNPASATEKPLEKWQTSALKAVKAEKTVIDARWRMPETNVLWVSMKPDGSSRDGFAQYICLLLMQAGAPEGDLKTVWIYEPATFETGGEAMGIAACR